VIIAPSGSDKSNFIKKSITLFSKGTGTFDNIYIFCKSRDEPLYRYLADKYKGLIEVYEDLYTIIIRKQTDGCF
jgi:hypothetical protein